MMRKPVPRRVILALFLLCGAVPAAFATVSSGAADIVLGQGTFTQSIKNCIDEYGFGSMSQGSSAVAIDTTTGRVYVADTAQNRILFWNSKGSLANGAGADGVIGQPTLFSTTTNRGLGTASCADNSLYNPRGLTVDAAGNLWVADTGNNRVLRFPKPAFGDNGTSVSANRVLGQTAFNLRGTGASDAALNSPYGLKFDSNGTLWVADGGNNRVLGYPNLSSDGAAATIVLGQAGFGTSGTGYSNTALFKPWSVAVDSANNVWVADQGNNRVVRFPATVSSGMPADIVLGQQQFDCGTANDTNGDGAAESVSSTTLNVPCGIAIDAANNVWVADKTNNRILKYAPPFYAGKGASLALGQQSFTLFRQNDSDGNGTTDGAQASANTLYAPSDVLVDENGDVWAADYTNYRVVRYSTPTASGASASLVIGQGDFAQNMVNSVDKKGLCDWVSGVAYDPGTGRIYVADSMNNRVLWWNSYDSLATHDSASGVLGQAVFSSTGSSRGSGTNANTLWLEGPTSGTGYLCGIVVDSHGTVWVADTKNNRVLGYYAPLTNGKDADIVIGQASFTGKSANQGGSAGNNTLNRPNGLAVDAADNLWVADMSNNRILRFDYAQQADHKMNMAASIVLGQQSFSGYGSNCSSFTLTSPYDVKVDASGNVWVADNGNHRVLKYPFPVSNGLGANLVLGQGASFTSGSPGAGISSLNGPKGISVTAGGSVWVADCSNSRVLRFDNPSTGSSASCLLGQADYNASNSNRGVTVNNNTLWLPNGIVVDGKNCVWIGDARNSRVVKYNNFYITSITPDRAANTMPVNITNLAGGDLQTGYEVRLHKDGEPSDITATASAPSPLQLTCTLNLTDKATGYWDVIVSTGGPGAVSSTLPAGFEIVPMEVSSISPATGGNLGTVHITGLIGCGFLAGSEVKLKKGGSEISATNVTVADQGQITCDFLLTGAGTGSWDIEVSSNAHVATLSGGFTVTGLSILVSTITPSFGYESGPVNITDLGGAGFTTDCYVRLVKDGRPAIPATNRDIYSSSMTCTFDLTGAATGFWDVVVSTGGVGSSSSTLAGGFEVRPMQVYSVAISTGFNSAAVVSTVTGQGFMPGSTVKLEKPGEPDIPGTGVTVYTSSMTCTFDLMGKTTGYWDLKVSTGAMSRTLAGGFALLPMQIASISPASAANTAALSVSTITGQGFVPGSAVRLVQSGQSVDGTVTVVVSTMIVCSFDDIVGKTTGYWDVVVSTGGPGAMECVLPGGLEVVSVIITSVTPSMGYNSGPVNMTDIRGVGFTESDHVFLVRSGTRIPATDQTMNSSSTSFTCTFDITGQATGYWDLEISTGDAGSYSFTLSSGFVVLPLQIASITPFSAANTAVLSISTITGQGFIPGSTVKLEKPGEPDIPGTGLTIRASSITCSFDILEKTTGYWNVVVTTGAVSCTLAGGFTILPMQVTGITPDNGYNSAIVNIAGIDVQGVLPGSQVKLVKGTSEIPGTDVMINANAISCTFDLTGQATGFWDVVVSTNAKSCTLAGGFNVLPMRITSLVVSTGANTATSFSLVVKGDGLLASCKGRLKRPGQEISAKSISNSFEGTNIVLTCTYDLWGAATGYWDVVVSTGDAGSFYCTLPSSFSIEPMRISSTTPRGAVNTDTAAGIALNGQGFLAGSNVRLTRDGEDDIGATNVSVTAGPGIATTLNGKFNLLGVSTGYWDVVVTTGAISSTLPGGFLIDVFLVTSIAPDSGYNNGPVSCVISGINFPPTSQVKLKRSGNASIIGSNVAVTSSSTISCTFDLARQATTGYWDVEVSTGVGSPATKTLTNGFTILPMQITSVTPNRAGNYGSTPVTLHGDGFLSSSAVQLFMTDQPVITASSVTVVNAGTITCLFNLTRKTTGSWDVSVSTGGAKAVSCTLAGAFEIVYSTENLTAVNPNADTTVTMTTESGGVTVAVPQGTFGDEVRLFLTETSPPASTRLTLKVTPVCYEITNDKGLQPRKEFILRIHYLDSDVVGVDETRLAIGRYDPAGARWVTYPSTVNTDENYVQANIDHLSKFALVALTPAADLSAVKVYPSPYSPLRHPLGLTIDNLPVEAEIRLFTVTGESVCTVPYTDQSGRAVWSGRNEAGQPVANGVYIALIKSPVGVKRVKIALEK